MHSNYLFVEGEGKVYEHKNGVTPPVSLSWPLEKGVKGVRRWGGDQG